MKHFMVKQKFRLDMGFQLWPLLNFTLLIVAASDKILRITGIASTTLLVLVAVPVAFITVWSVGYCLDKMRYMQGYIKEQGTRNPYWEKQVAYYEAILREVRK